MMKISRFLAFALLILQPLFVSADEAATCVEKLTAPVIPVADFDANGIVNGKDIAMLAKYMKKNRNELAYSPLFDRNGDGEIDNIDMHSAARDMGRTSTPAQQRLANINNEVLAGTYSCKDKGSRSNQHSKHNRVEEETVTCDFVDVMLCPK